MKVEVYIPVSVIVDTDTGACHLGEIGSEAWPADMFGNVWIPNEDGDGEWHHSREMSKEVDAAYVFMDEALRDEVIRAFELRSA